MDSRCNLKIEFSIYGEDFKWESSINYTPDDDSGVDSRVADWFKECYRKARYKYEEEMYEAQRAERERKTEAEEREQLARLKEKYEGT